MLCPICKIGTVRVTNLSRKYATELRAVNEGMLLPATELGILQILHTEKAALRAAFIAGELDCSHQLIGKRGKFLAEPGLVKRSFTKKGNSLFEIVPTAEAAYFSESERDDLQVPADP